MRSTRSKILLTVALVLFAAASLLAVAGQLGLFERAREARAEAPAYQLRVWQGRIGLFSPPDAEEPVTVADVNVQALPPTDRLALLRGVDAPDRQSAARLMEDYGA